MDDIDKTIPPRRVPERVEFDADVTMPGKRDRQSDGRFAVGDLIMNRYKVLAELGRGGMGVVYKCFDEVSKIEIALKALPPELSHNTQEMKNIQRNFQLVHNLHHPNIASYNTLEYDNSNGNYYLIMECCAGEDLRSWLLNKSDDNGLPLETVLPVVKQIAAALDYAHSEKIIHRDIKPGNVMIDVNGKVKVLDFGLAAQIHTSMTRVSMVNYGTSGTGPYMAPEQWRGKRQNAPVDQYALAVMTYEMLAGHLPFESTDPAVLQQAVLTQEAEPISDIPKAAQNALKRAMSKEPAERFNNCTDFVAALTGAKVKAAKVQKTNGFPKWVAAVIVGARRYADFTGRATRREFSLFMLRSLLVFCGNCFLSAIFLAVDAPVLSFLIMIANTIIIVPIVSVTIRRLHDINWHWAWVFAILMPVFAYVLAFVPSSNADNEFGPAADDSDVSSSIIFTILSVVAPFTLFILFILFIVILFIFMFSLFI